MAVDRDNINVNRCRIMRCRLDYGRNIGAAAEQKCAENDCQFRHHLVRGVEGDESAEKLRCDEKCQASGNETVPVRSAESETGEDETNEAEYEQNKVHDFTSG